MITVIVGPRSSGKTTVALALMSAMNPIHSGGALFLDEYADGEAFVCYSVTDLTNAWKRGKKPIDFKDKSALITRNVYITSCELTDELKEVADFTILVNWNS